MGLGSLLRVMQTSDVKVVWLLLCGVIQTSDVKVMWLLLRGVMQASDVKAVWRLHTVMPLINFETPSAADLKNLLGRCCSSAQYLKIDEVRHAKFP